MFSVASSKLFQHCLTGWWQKSATERLETEVQRLCRQKNEFVSEAHLLTLGRFISMLATLDELKNAKASIKNDFSFFKRSPFTAHCRNNFWTLLIKIKIKWTCLVDRKLHHLITQFFTGQMLFLIFSQQCQSTVSFSATYQNFTNICPEHESFSLNDGLSPMIILLALQRWW